MMEISGGKDLPFTMYTQFSRKKVYYLRVSGGRNVSFSENISYLINWWSLGKNFKIL